MLQISKSFKRGFFMLDMYFIEFFDPYKVDFVEVVIPDNKIKLLEEFASKVIQKKSEENHHKIDNGSEYKRFYTGMLGELALEQYLNIDFVDLSIGDSQKYAVADLK